MPHQKTEILWRTATSRELMKPDVAWKRVKLIEKELKALAKEAENFEIPGRSHQDLCNMVVRSLFYKNAGDPSKSVPAHWEHAHNHVIMCFRLYYSGSQLDPTFPPPVLAREISVPDEKPKDYKAAGKIDTDDVDVAALLGSSEGDERRKLLAEVREHLDILKEFEGVIDDTEIARRKRALFASLPSAPAPFASPGSPAPPSSSKKAKMV
jgi:hypothetical protein